jgi:hypothetical protein
VLLYTSIVAQFDDICHISQDPPEKQNEIERDTHKDIYTKLTQGTEKADIPSASWRPRHTGVFQTMLRGLRTR